MNFAKFLRTPFLRTPPVAVSELSVGLSNKSLSIVPAEYTGIIQKCYCHQNFQTSRYYSCVNSI